jgi:hypothetical protein
MYILKFAYADMSTRIQGKIACALLVPDRDPGNWPDTELPGTGSG